jgi:hypothetical protein
MSVCRFLGIGYRILGQQACDQARTVLSVSTVLSVAVVVLKDSVSESVLCRAATFAAGALGSLKIAEKHSSFCTLPQ